LFRSFLLAERKSSAFLRAFLKKIMRLCRCLSVSEKAAAEPQE
jgi:hypothetical protein